MPCLSGKYDPAIGPIITLGLLPPNTLDPTTPPAQAPEMIPALVDTGASGTCISPDVARTLDITPIGKRPMISATHAIPVNVYLVDMLILFGPSTFAIKSIEVMEFAPPNGSSFQILLGRNIICQGAFTLSFDGHFSFSL